MQRSNEDPIWDLVICIAGGAGTIVCLFWATLMFNQHVPVFVDRRIAALACIIMAALMLSTALSYWHQWKQRR